MRVGTWSHAARVWLTLSSLAAVSALAQTPPDLTAPGAYVDTTYTWNLGPTGCRGWMYNEGNEWLFSPEGLSTQSRQILITHVEQGSPAWGVLQTNDVILGIGSALFTNDARKAFGLAIGEAEKVANSGQLKLKVWRNGVTIDNVTLALAVMGSYSDTAPYNCPKSAMILSNACNYMATQPVNNGSTEGSAVIGLSLLAAGRTQDVARVQTYARSIAPQDLSLTIPVNAMVAWPWAYNNLFLSEYYLATGDTNVLHAVNEYSTTIAEGQSVFGTYGHGMAWSKSDGSSTHGYVPVYGALNQAGLVCNLSMVMGKKCGVTNAEVVAAIDRGRKFFGRHAWHGTIPYGEGNPEELHDDNGKNATTGLLLALQDQADMSAQARWFAKMCTAGYALREFGHTGPGFCTLWQSLGANLGGTNAMSAHFKQISWHLDLLRRWNGTFAYDAAAGGTPGSEYLGANSATAFYMLTYAAPLRKLYITGKNPNLSYWLGTNDVNEAIEDGRYSLGPDIKGMTTNELMAALESWSPQKRRMAATELGTRTNAAALVPGLITLAQSTNMNARMGACQALGAIKNTNALSTLVVRLSDSDSYVRFLAAQALESIGSSARPVLSDMLSAIMSNAQPIEPINDFDPAQNWYGALGSAVFRGQLASSVSGVATNLLYPAIVAIARSYPRAGALYDFFSGSALKTNDVRALAPVLTTTLMTSHEICDCNTPQSVISLLSRYNYEEGIAAAMVFHNIESGRGWFPYGATISMNALQKYRSAARATLPELYYWNTNADISALGMGVGDLSPTIAVIETDTNAPPALLYFKTVTSASATPTTLTLPSTNTALLRASGTDIDGGALTYTWSKVQGPGSVTFSTNGTAGSTNCLATFDTPGSYVVRVAIADATIGDGTNGYSAVFSNLAIRVNNASNAVPVAQNQSLTTAVDTPTNIVLTATDANGDLMTFSILASTAHGVLSGTLPNLVYTPTNGYTGPDTFTFKVNDGTVDSSVATVTIDVGMPGNRRPVAYNQAVTTAEDTARAITLAGSDPDGNTLTYSIAAYPAHGTLSGTPPNVTYTPATNFPYGVYDGSDSFSFTVRDASLTSAVATVNITVTPVNDPPAADSQSLAMAEDTVQSITLTGTDPEGYPLAYTVKSLPAGTLSGVAPDLTYTPAPNYHGTTSFKFTVTDAEGLVSPVATVTINVTNINDTPVALNRSMPVTNNTPTAIVLDGSDIDGDPLTYTVLTQPQHGTLSGTPPYLTYAPATNYAATDSFTFKVNDGKVDSANIGTVSLSMGTVYTGIYSEFFQQPPTVNGWPDMANLMPDTNRIDTQMSIAHNYFPSNYEDHFSSRHIAFVKAPTSGNYTFTIGADDNTRVYVDEAWVIEQIFPSSGSCTLQLTAGYHGIRVEFVETYGDNYFNLYWSGPGFGQQLVPASVFFRCVGNSGPPAPTGLTATPGNAAIALEWVGSARVTSYTVKRSLLPGGAYTVLATNLAASSFSDTSVTNGITYYYVVSATGFGDAGGYGEGLDSNEAFAAPSATATINVNYSGGSSATMNGYSSSDATARGTASRVAPAAYPGTTWNDFGSGNGLNSSSLRNSTNALTGASLFTTTDNTGIWADWNGLGGARMLISGRIGGYLTYQPVITITNLNQNHAYHLYIAGLHNDNNRPEDFRVGTVEKHIENNPGGSTDWADGLNYAHFLSLAPDSAGRIVVEGKMKSSGSGYMVLNGFQLVDVGAQPPPTPTGLTASTESAQVHLSWAASTWAAGYQVKRALTFGGPYSAIGTTSDTNYTDSAVVTGTQYYYVVSATNAVGQSGNSAWCSATPTVLAGQTITFGALAAKTVGDAPFALTAAASSGLPVSYASSDPTVATVTNSTVTILKAGTTTITASQAGNANFSAAAPVAQMLAVNQLPVILTGARIYDGTTNAAATNLSIANNVDGTNLTLSGSAALAGKDAASQPVVTIFATPARVRSATGAVGSSAASSFSVTVAAPASGNTLIAVISTRSTSADAVLGISNSGTALTWQRAVQTTPSSSTTTEIWYAPAVSGAGTAITISLASSMFAAAVVGEYSGVLTPNPVDATANNSNGSNSTAANTGTTAATTQGNEVWIGGIGLRSSGYTLGTPSNSFTAVTNASSGSTTATSNARVYFLEKIVTSTGTASSGGTVSSSSRWSGAIATFKAAPGLALGGAAAANYTLAGMSGAMTITPKALTLTGAVVSNKTYDATAAATLTGGALQAAEAPGGGTTADGKPYTGDTVALTLSGAFDTKDAGTGKAVTSTSTLSGAQAGNYTLTQPAGLTGSIAARAATVTANNQSKTYGQTLAFGSGSTLFSSIGLVAGETIGTVTLTCAGGAAAAGVTGSPYPITPSAAAGGTFNPVNYALSYAAGQLTVNKATPVIAWSDPAPIVVGTPLSGTQLNATSGGVAGGFVYEPPSGTVLSVGSYVLGAQFTPADTNNYNVPAVKQVTLNVTPQPTTTTSTSTSTSTSSTSTSTSSTSSTSSSSTTSSTTTTLGAVATQSSRAGYVPGGTIDVTNKFTKAAGTTNTAMTLAVTLPEGCSLATDADGYAIYTANGNPSFDGYNSWVFTVVNSSTYTLVYTLAVPAARRGTLTINAQWAYKVKPSSSFTVLNPAPLQIRMPHSADYQTQLDGNGSPAGPPDWTIDVYEMGRVVELWQNPGAYHIDTNAIDGYGWGAGDTNGLPHSADYETGLDEGGNPIPGHDWIIDIYEMARVIELWQFPGAYHPDVSAQPNRMDGYVPGR